MGVALQCTFIFMDQQNNKIHKNFYLTNIDETTVMSFQYHLDCL